MKTIVYTVPYTTEAQIHKANRLRMKLYNKYNSVQIYPNGLDELRIIATDKIKA